MEKPTHLGTGDTALKTIVSHDRTPEEVYGVGAANDPVATAVKKVANSPACIFHESTKDESPSKESADLSVTSGTVNETVGSSVLISGSEYSTLYVSDKTSEYL